ncbi:MULTISPECIES: hypothetical protein [Bradyrhizobium]|uniref:Uncharacterized protein n=1 Tax=Bradyrhizobium ottawaense TaxID=931866 RepID=A0A2U8PC36_9BRAD|nr:MULTISPECIES: hypothetical protein [Bradyrhizobium]AWL94927.1 hypothetical protein CIT37_24290 [Bradyrhizobium ottawaense]MBR1324504.1 hypothetical protein [Bradyrhizobium ottawaense]MBR1332670.1 hypothetical protein [Bradyrhizobium ottawaense]PDT69616.1 hypothetical protein CO683_12295 [Bradyrhizobium ottawaense]
MTTVDTTADRPAPKKAKISQFRRLLWHVNRTDLGWVLKAALTSLQLPARAKRVALLKQLPTKPEWAEASRKLDEDGYVDVSAIVDRGLAEAVASFADGKVNRLQELVGRQKEGHKSFWVSLLDEDLVNGAFATDHPFVRYALQPAALRIIGDFMHDLPQLSDVVLTLSQPTPNQALSFSQLWHLDHDDKRVCKLFIYLTDVQNTADGPFTFIPAGPSKAFRNSLKSHMSDAQVFAKTGPDAVKEMIAPRLSSFIVNTARCLHMGSRIQSDHSRLLYTATYIQQPRIFPEPPARFRAVGALTDLERTVMRL